MEHIIEYNGRRRVASDLEALKLGQQQDQNAEERIFLFPRYLEGFDLSGFACGLLLSGAGWVDRQELILEETGENTLSYRWAVPALVTSTGKPVVFQPVFQNQTVIIHLDKDIFTVDPGIDLNGEIETCYPDYIDGLKEKADKKTVYTKEEVDKIISQSDAQWQLIKNAGALPNLLANSSSVVWQRGTSFTLTLGGTAWQYCDDRWRYKLIGSSGAGAVISKNADGGVKITMVGSGTVTRQQVLDQSIVGTLTSCIDGEKTAVPHNGTIVEQQFTKTCTVNWTKLETGEIATPFSPKSYREELTACRWYYREIAGGDVVGSGYMNAGGNVAYILVPFTMRALPAFSVSSLNNYRIRYTSEDKTPTSLTVLSMNGAGITLNAAVSGISARQPVSMYYSSDNSGVSGKLIFDAEIYD